MIIIGAGMSGLLCGALNTGSVIYEAGPERESDHKALFRCKTNEIGKILGIPFKKVEVHKGLWDNGHIEPSIRSAHMYSRKVTGKITGRSIINIEPGVRYIPPPDFIDRLKARCKIEYNIKWNFDELHVGVKISTIPLHFTANMSGIGIDTPAFQPIYVNKMHIQNCDSYCTMYYPNQNLTIYRASISGNTLTTEGTELLDENDLHIISESLGLPTIRQIDVHNHKQNMGKISSIDEKTRQHAISQLTLKYNTYSLGRFATWRPKVMLDDVLEDIFVIRRLIEGGNYASLNHKQGEK